jgi:hypothetical protein
MAKSDPEAQTKSSLSNCTWLERRGVSIPTYQEPMNLKTHARSYEENIERCAFLNFMTDFIAKVKRM